MKLIEEVGFDQSFSFIYSRRPGTPAADLEDSAASEEKHARLARLQAHINEYSAGISRAMVGSVQKVLVTGPSRQDSNEMTGKTENMRSVHFHGHSTLAGRFVAAVLTAPRTTSWRGPVPVGEGDGAECSSLASGRPP